MKKFLLSMFLFSLFFSNSVFANSSEYKLNTIAKTILCENYSDYEDQLRILSVIHNRAIKKYSKASLNNYYKVISEKNQFSCYKKKRHYSDIKILLISNAIKDMINGHLFPLFSATHFYNRYLDNPKWRFNLKVVFVGKHHIYLV